MRITRLELSNIGPFVSATIDFPAPTGKGELVLFEGPNGAGKSTILYSIVTLLSGTDTTYVGPGLSLLAPRLRDETDINLMFQHSLEEPPTHIKFNRNTNRVDFVPPLRRSDARRLLEDYRGEGATIEWAAFLHESHGKNATIRDRNVVLDLDRGQNARQAALALNPSSHRGKDLCKLLISIRKDRDSALGRAQAEREHAEYFESIAAALTRDLAQIKNAFTVILDRHIEFEFIGKPHINGLVIKIDGREIEADLLGEGMRSSLSWLSDLVFRLHRIEWADKTLSPCEQEFWLIFDEIEASLHPSRQMQLIPAIRSTFPNARIYAATHSPFVVASAGEGTVIPIRPGKDHMVRGKIEARALERGQSLEWVVSEIFQAHTGFIDQQTRDDLDAHDRDVRAVRRKQSIDWQAFLKRREKLWGLNEEVRTVVAMQEVPIRAQIEQQLRAQADASRGGTES